MTASISIVDKRSTQGQWRLFEVQNGSLLREMESPGQLLATLLGRGELESQFSPCMTRPGMFNASLLDTLAALAADVAAMPLTPSRRGGRFRSSRVPNQSEYTLIRPSDCPTNQDHLKGRRGGGAIVRRSRGVGRRLGLVRRLPPRGGVAGAGKCRADGCTRDGCGGTKGGFSCPFTRRAVCERVDCSSTASSWVPSGAYACRVERDSLRGERAPILGL